MKAVVKYTIDLDGVTYNPGDTVELTKEQALSLAENLDNGAKAALILEEDEGPKVPNLKKMNKDELIAILENYKVDPEDSEARLDYDPNATKAILMDLIVEKVEGYKDAII